MGEALICRLEAAVSRLEALSGARACGGLSDTTASAQDPAILAFDDLVATALGRVSAAAGKIGADVAEVTGLLEKAFLVGKDLLVRNKQTQLPRDLNFIDHTSDIGWKEFQRAKPVIIDPGLYMKKKADVFWIPQRRSVPTAFKLFTGCKGLGHYKQRPYSSADVVHGLQKLAAKRGSTDGSSYTSTYSESMDAWM